MTTPDTAPESGQGLLPLQALAVYRAGDFTVTDGANLGDPLADFEELMLDDIYQLAPAARPVPLSISDAGHGPFVIAENAAADSVGTPGNALHLDCTLTLMAANGPTIEALVLAEVAPARQELEQIYLLPLAALRTRTPYRLIGADRDSAAARFAQIACVSFSRGTHIALAGGRQCPVEDLRVGQRVLTRDEGPQTIRWIGQTTQRAVGEFAPIVIARGVLNNENDLVLSPNHRLFIYQRQDELQAGHPELLVKARHLVNGTTVQRREGGFVDYFQLLFDRHQIIYAEGIAAESLLLDRRTSPALPKAVTQKLREGLQDRSALPGLDVDRELLLGADAVERLRRASAG